ncbi:MAG: Gfo/Idh/MocA family oxidoreductase [Gammaproteobacteria bacterium]|nr:Gfo/Idh/MocA family oxidoreductase [Gammaproteobacteria bacterium]
MPGRIKWGILGTGRIAGSFAAALNSFNDAELYGVASRSAEKAGAFSREHSVTKSFHDYESLAADPEVDVVYIATPHSLHKENSLMCLEHGNAVLCEKPFAINAVEAYSVIAYARQRQLFLMEAMWTRFIPAAIKLKQLVADKTIGEIRYLFAGGAFLPEFDPDFYLFRKDLGGGVLLDAGVYLVSLASWLLGYPDKIRCAGRLNEHGIDEHEAMLLEYDSGAIAGLYVSMRTRSSPDITILGSKGKIYVHPPLFCPSKIILSLFDEEETEITLPFASNGYQFEAMEVHRCLREGKTESAVMPLGETLGIMRTMDEIRGQFGLKYPME